MPETVCDRCGHGLSYHAGCAMPIEWFACDYPGCNAVKKFTPGYAAQYSGCCLDDPDITWERVLSGYKPDSVAAEVTIEKPLGECCKRQKNWSLVQNRGKWACGVCHALIVTYVGGKGVRSRAHDVWLSEEDKPETLACRSEEFFPQGIRARDPA